MTRENQTVNHDTISYAIRSKQLLTFLYQGGYRFVEPYCYGENDSNKKLLIGYQVRGYSQSSNSTGWKVYNVDEIVGLFISSQTFKAKQNEALQLEHGVKQVYCSV